MNIPFTKAHGLRNDFLLTWAHEAPRNNLHVVARAICDRHSGVGADGWLLVAPAKDGAPPSLRLFNPDGGEVEMSGNGTRCAAAFLCDAGLAAVEVAIQTGGGLKQLRLLERRGLTFLFEMNMGRPAFEGDVSQDLALSECTADLTIVNVGNPQCAVFVDHFDFDWRKLGAEIETHPMFPNRTNVSFVRTVDAHTIEARFYERGAGATLSSGTGATGAVVSAIARGGVRSPVTIETEAGPLHFVWDGGDILMRGPAEITAGGEFYFAE